MKYQLKIVEWHSTPTRSQLPQVSMADLDGVFEHTVEPLYSTISCQGVERGTMVTNIPSFQKSSKSSRCKLKTVVTKNTQWTSIVAEDG